MTEIRELVQDPHDSTSTLAWDALTTEQQKKGLKLYKQLVRRISVHYVIRINLKGGPNPPEGGYGAVYPHIIYPVQFNSADDAWDFLSLSPDPALRPPNLKGWSVETVRPAALNLPEPKVRSTNLELAPRRKRK